MEAEPVDVTFGTSNLLASSVHGSDERSKGYANKYCLEIKIHNQRRTSTFLATRQFYLDEKSFWQKLLSLAMKILFYMVGEKKKKYKKPEPYTFNMLKPRVKQKAKLNQEASMP